MAAGRFCGSHHLFVGGIGAAEFDVVLYAVLEEIYILKDHGDVPQQTFAGKFFHIAAAHRHGAAVCVIEAGYQIAYRALAGAGRPHNGGGGASGRNDAALSGMILQLYEFSRSYPWPKKWLPAAAESYSIEDEASMESAAFMQSLLQNLKRVSEDLVALSGHTYLTSFPHVPGTLVFTAWSFSSAISFLLIVTSDRFVFFEADIALILSARL